MKLTSLIFAILPAILLGQYKPDTVVAGVPYKFLDVVIIAGQSNAGVQNSRIDSLTPQYKLRQPGVFLWRDEINLPVVYEASSIGDRVEYPTGGAEYGYGLVFGREYFNRYKRPLLVIKHSVGGTKLGPVSIIGGSTWDPDQPNDLYSQLMSKWEGAKSYYRSRGVWLRTVAIIWAQGEADASVQELADVYQAELNDFIPRLSSDVDYQGRWLMTLLRANTTRCCEAQVRTAITNVATAGGHLVFDLDTFPNPGAGDDTHVGEIADEIALVIFNQYTTIKP